MVVSLLGNRNLQPRGFITGQTSGTFRLKYPIDVAATNVRLIFPGWVTGAPGTGDTATGNTITLAEVKVEVGGSVYPVTFSAASSGVVPSGGNLQSDAVAGLTVAPGTVLDVRTYFTVASGGQLPNLYGQPVYPDEVWRPGTNLANGTGDLTGTGQAFGQVYGPHTIVGDVTSPLYAICILGDSRVAGVNDSFSDETQVGYWQRKLYPGSRPFRIVGAPGESALQYLTGSQAALRAGIVGDYAQHLVNEYGINDLQGGATLAQVQARVRSIALTTSSDATLVKRLQETLPPKTASTDGWTTTANQTTDGINTIRVQFNDWVRDGMPETSGVAVATGTVGALRAGAAGHPYTGYLEVADLCETARNSGIWKANYTPDGLHLGPAGNAAVAAAIDVTPFADTAASSGGGGGTSGLAYVAASSPAIRSSPFQGSGLSQAWASNSFSPPASSLIVVEAAATQSFNNAWNTPTITDSLATHLTWTRVDTQANNTFSGVVSTVSYFYALCPTAQTGMTVTVTQSLAGSGQTVTFSSVDVRVFTGHDTTAPIGATTKGATTAQSLAVALTPTGSGSALLLGAANAAASSAATTAGTGEYLAGETHTGTSFVSAWFGNSSGPTIPATAQTLDLTGNTAARWQYVAVEVKGAAATAASYTPSAADAAAGSDAASAVAAAVRTAADPVGGTDAASSTVAAVRAVDDAAGFSDAVAVAVGAAAAASDAVAGSDAATTAASAVRPAADAVGGVDAAAVELAAARLAQDAAGGSDQASTVVTADRVAADAASFSDAVVVSLTGVSSQTVADAAGFADACVAVLDRVVTVADFLALTDAADAASGRTVQLDDLMSGADAAGALLVAAGGASAADLATLSDTCTFVMQRSVLVSDLLRGTDQATSVRTGPVTDQYRAILTGRAEPPRWTGAVVEPRWTGGVDQ